MWKVILGEVNVESSVHTRHVSFLVQLDRASFELDEFDEPLRGGFDEQLLAH